MDLYTRVRELLCERYKVIMPNCNFKKKYYLSVYNDNFFISMSNVHISQYDEGDGNELDCKIYATHSSAAMAFNLFGNDQCEFIPNIFNNTNYFIKYEMKHDTLKKSKMPANFDVVLTSPDKSEMLFFEIKMTEWLYKYPICNNIVNAYFDDNRYYYPESFLTFCELFIKINKILNDKNKHCRFDLTQMGRNLLALYNYMKNINIKPSSINYINCVWTINNPLVLKEFANDYIEYYNIYQEEYRFFSKLLIPVFNLFEQLGINFKIECVTFNQLLNIMVNDDKKINYLNRYII